MKDLRHATQSVCLGRRARSGLHLAAKVRLAAGNSPREPLERRQYGRTEERLSVIGFGGMVVQNVTAKEASAYVAEAVDRGVNYVDVAPFYGNAQERLGPALEPYRRQCFLACKTLERDAAGAAAELDESLRLLRTDHFDLYQLHALIDLEEVEQAFGPGGAVEVLKRPAATARSATSASRPTAKPPPMPRWTGSTSIRSSSP